MSEQTRVLCFERIQQVFNLILGFVFPVFAARQFPFLKHDFLKYHLKWLDRWLAGGTLKRKTLHKIEFSEIYHGK